jgi:hypothetical protein
VGSFTGIAAGIQSGKGSIPVLKNPDLTKMDSCARNAWKVFSGDAAAQVPSFAHRMATDEISRDAMMNEIHRFFMDDQMSVEEARNAWQLWCGHYRKIKQEMMRKILIVDDDQKTRSLLKTYLERISMKSNWLITVSHS